MRRFGRVAAVCGAALVALAATAQASQDMPEIRRAARAAASHDWASLRIDDRARVLFPARYVDERMTHEGYTNHIYRAECAGVFYSVDVEYFGAPPARGAEGLLAKWFESYPANISGELVLARPIRLAGHPGREFEVVFKNGLMQGRVFVVGDRAYALVVFFDGDLSIHQRAEIDRFLRSLELDGSS